MSKWKIISLTVLALLAFNAHAWASMDPFTDPRPTYEFDWTFGAGYTLQAASGKWYNLDQNAVYAAKSAGDGTAYENKYKCYWTAISGVLNGFSVSNSIGDWLYAIDVGVEASIRYTIREGYSPIVDNSDVVELTAFGSEAIVIHGHGGSDSLGIADANDSINALEWNEEFGAENLGFEHYFAVQGSGGVYQPNVYVGKNMDDENVYMTWGARAYLVSNNLYRVYRANKVWDGTGNGCLVASSPSISTAPVGSDESLGEPSFDGTNWFLPVTVGGTTYWQRFDEPYDEPNYPTNSGAPIQWYDDYDLYNAGTGIPDPTTIGVSGRYVLERDVFLGSYGGYSWSHAADVCYEARTYNPTRNTDGPESPYEWVYDASGDMYSPTDGSGLPGDTDAERAFKLIGVHPAFPNDDTVAECEYPDDRNIWKNQAEGVEGRSLFVESWRLAGLMLGQDFWNVDPDYAWSGEIGAVAERVWADEFVDISYYTKFPNWTWDSVAVEWVLPDTNDYYATGRHHIWSWVNTPTDTPVAGYDALNNFMRYVFDIDALVVEDVDGDGEFDEGDYILFSVVDDGLYHMYPMWGKSYTPAVDSFFDGQYFDGDTIFLYDGTTVTTYFDATAGIFFGQVSGAGAGADLWGGAAYYDINALDINVIPEPSTIFLMIGSGGLAMLAGIMRRKLR